MKLTDLKVCANCEDVHTEFICPVCASEHFTYLQNTTGKVGELENIEVKINNSLVKFLSKNPVIEFYGRAKSHRIKNEIIDIR